MGRSRVSGAKIEGYYPVIVDQTLANDARRSIDSRPFGGRGAGRKGKVYSNLLTGVARCGECGGSTFLAHRSPQRDKTGWLRCSNASRDNGCRNNIGIPYQPLEEALLRDVCTIESIQVQLPKSDPTQALIERLAEKEAEYKRTNDTITALTDTFGITPLKAIADQIKQRSEHRDTIEQEIAELRKSLDEVRREAEKPNLMTAREQIIAQMMSASPRDRYEARSRVASALRDSIKTMTCYADKSISLAFFPSENIIVDELDMPDTSLGEEVEHERGEYYTPAKTVESTVRLVMNYGVDLAPEVLIKVGNHDTMEVTGIDPAEIAHSLRDRLYQSTGRIHRDEEHRP